MILTDREIPISLDRRLTTIVPQPEEIAVTASTVDLTLDPLIWIVRDPAPMPENIVDPRAAGFNACESSRPKKQSVKEQVFFFPLENWS